MSKIKALLKAHAFAFTVAALIVGGFVLALRERDAKMVAENKIKEAESRVAALEADETKTDSQTKARVVAIEKAAAAVKTPKQAVTALETTDSPVAEVVAPLQVEELPNDPSRVSVEAVPLYAEISAHAEDSAKLAGCTQDLADEKQIVVEKNIELKATKPSFFRRLAHGAKVTACAAVGGAAGGYAKGAQGAAVGAAAGAAVCQMF